MLAMTVSDECLNEFIQLWEQAYGERLDIGEARSIATPLVRLYRFIMRPLPEGASPENKPSATAKLLG